MALTDFTPDELAEMKLKGIDPNTAYVIPDDSNNPTIPQTIGRTLKAHAGGILGGGAGVLGAAALIGAPETMGASLLALPTIAAAGAAGGYGGQKLQQGITPEETYNQQQLEAGQAASVNPKTALATDIVASALASGGKPSSDALKGVSGLIGKLRYGADLTPEARQALIGATINAGVNPAINTGINVATTGQLPSASDIAAQIAGGALFSKQAGWASRLTGNTSHAQPAPDEPSTSDPTNGGLPQQPTRLQLTAPRRFYGGESGSVIDINSEPVADANNSNPPSQPTNDKGQLLLPEKSSAPLSHGDEVHVIDQNGNPIIGHVVGSDDNGNIQIIDHNNNIHTLPEQYTKPKSEQQRELVTFGNDKGNEYAWKYEDGSLEHLDELGTRSAIISEGLKNGYTLEQIKTEISKLNYANPQQTTVEAVRSNTPGLTPQMAERVPGGLQQTPVDSQTETQGLPTSQQTGTDNGQKGGTDINEMSNEELLNYALDRLPDNIKKDITPGLKIKKDVEFPSTLEGSGGILKGKNILLEKGEPLDHDVILHELLHDYVNKHPELYDANNYQGMEKAVDNLHSKILDKESQEDLQKQLEDSQNQTTSNIFGKLDSLKVDTKGQLHAFGLVPEVWNTMIDGIKLAIKGGMAIKDAIAKGIASVKSTGAKFDEDGATKHLNEQFKSTDIPQTKEGGFIGRKFQSMIDRISRIPHPDAIPLAGGLKKTLIEAQQQRGATTNGVLSTAKKYGIKSGDYNDNQVDKARKWESIHNSDPSFMLKNNAQRALYAAIKNAKAISGSTQFRGNQPVYAGNHPRAFIQDPHHLETPIEPKVAKIIKEGTDLKSIEKFKQDYIDNATNNYGKSNADAVTSWKELVDNVTGKSSNTAPNMQKFAGARVAQGTPLPDSMRTKGIKSLEYYFNRLALNNSYYKNIESNPRIMAALGETKDAWGNDIPKSDNNSLASNQDVKKQLEEFHGHKLDQTAHNEEAISNLMTSMFIANPGLEVHKVISNIVGAISTADNPMQAAKSLAHAVVNLKSGYDHSVANGVTRLTAKSTSNMWDSNATFAERLQGLAQGIRNIATGFGASTAFNDGLMQSSMEYVLPSKIAKANSGDITAMQFMRKLDPDYQKGLQYKPDEINKLASEAVGYIHGTHDGRTMPSWMAGDSEISGFFKLAHWSVSQTNRFISDIYNPATRGELGPLVTSIFGAAIGGYLIKDIREKLQGKKYSLPSLEDIQNSDKGLRGNAGLLAYNAIAASQYAGFAGILSQIARVPFDIAYKNEPQGAAFPLDEIATDLARTLSSIGTAAANDPHFNWFDGAKAVMNHVLSNDFQLGRIAINQGINNGFITGMPADKKMLSDKIQQLRKFDMVEGLPYEENDPGSNPYMNLEQKKFHMEQNIPEAVKQLPGLVNETIQAYKGQPDVLLAKLKALKDSSYETMPNPDTYPLEFHNYINYLDRESPGLGQSILQDYMRHKFTNQVKSSVVP